jgi:cytochrome oxidase Cu insertion factor (SCO1/SenC/PrrC family)
MRARIAVAFVMSTLVLLAACAPTDEPVADGSFLAEGDRAPDFTLPSAAGEDVSLDEFANQRPVLLYFSMGPG